MLAAGHVCVCVCVEGVGVPFDLPGFGRAMEYVATFSSVKQQLSSSMTDY